MTRPWLHQIDPVALDLGFFAIHWYGVMYLIGFGAFLLLGRLRLADPRRGMTWDQLTDLLFWGVLGVILGGRIGYLLFYAFGDWLRDPLLLFRLQQGGMSFHGGLLGVGLALVWWSRRQGRSAWDTLDFVAPLSAVGLGLGRLGNFIGGELWGRHTDLSWAVIFPASLNTNLAPEALRSAWLAGQLDQEGRHPSQLYQAFLEGVLLFALVWWFSSKPRPRMAVTGLFLALYGLFRIIVEFVREPDAHIGYLAFGWLTMGQLLSLPLVLLGIGLMVWGYRSSAAATLPKSS